MTYKLEPGLSRISSPVCLIFSDGRKVMIENGLATTEAEFDRKWRVVEIRAVDGIVEVVVEEMNVPVVNTIGEETFF